MSKNTKSTRITRRSALGMAAISGGIGLAAGAGISAGVGTFRGTGTSYQEPTEGVKVSDGLEAEGWFLLSAWTERYVEYYDDNPLIVVNRSEEPAYFTYYIGGSRAEKLTRDGEEVTESKVDVDESKHDFDGYEFHIPDHNVSFDQLLYVTEIEIEWHGETIEVDTMARHNHAIWLTPPKKVWTGRYGRSIIKRPPQSG